MGTLSRVAFRTGDGCFKFLKGVRLLQLRPFCNKATNTSTTTTNNSSSIDAAAVRNNDAYRQLEKLDFMTAAKLLFTTPPKKKQFGIDFHLVQLFFACMPSLAVYLVAQYARYEIRRMEAEVELKKKQAEEEKAKEMESSGMGEKGEVGSDPELFKVKVRLDALEEALKEIVVESKKLSGENLIKDQEASRREQRATVDPNLQNKLEGSGTIADNDSRAGKEKVNALQQDQEKRAGKAENEGGSSVLKK